LLESSNQIVKGLDANLQPEPIFGNGTVLSPDEVPDAPERGCRLRESEIAYQSLFDDEKGSLRLEIVLFWNRFPHLTMT
jgi:hypothetical protein